MTLSKRNKSLVVKVSVSWYMGLPRYMGLSSTFGYNHDFIQISYKSFGVVKYLYSNSFIGGHYPRSTTLLWSLTELFGM